MNKETKNKTMNWRDISSAPKDGSLILITGGMRVYPAMWDSGSKDWALFDVLQINDDIIPETIIKKKKAIFASMRAEDATAWMPLPEPPEDNLQ